MKHEIKFLKLKLIISGLILLICLLTRFYMAHTVLKILGCPVRDAYAQNIFERKDVKKNEKILKTRAELKSSDYRYIAALAFEAKTSSYSAFEAGYFFNIRFKKRYSVAGGLLNQMPLIKEMNEFFIPLVKSEVSIFYSDTFETAITDNDGFFCFNIKADDFKGDICFKVKKTGITGNFLISDTVCVKLDQNKNHLVKLFMFPAGDGSNSVDIKFLSATSNLKVKFSGDNIFKKSVTAEILKKYRSAGKVSAIYGRVLNFIRGPSKNIMQKKSGIKDKKEDASIDSNHSNQNEPVDLILLPEKKEITADSHGYFKFNGNFKEGIRVITAKTSAGFEKTAEVNIIKPYYGFNYHGVSIRFNSIPIISNITALNNSDDISIFYDVFDEDIDSCSISLYYSIDNGVNFYKTFNFHEISSFGEPGFFMIDRGRRRLIWRSREDIAGNSSGVVIKIIVFDGFQYSAPAYSKVFSIRNNRVPVISNVIISGASDEITINYDIFDPDDNTNSVSLYYSLDNAASFIKTKNISGDINFVTCGVSKKIIWRSRSDIKTDSHNIKLKLTAFDGNDETRHRVSRAVSVFNNFYRPVIEISGVSGDSNEISAVYNLYDTDENSCLMEMSYSLDSKRFIRTISVSGDINGIKPGTGRLIKWNSRNDLKIDTNNLYIELAAFDGTGYGNKSIYGPFELKNNRAPYAANIYPADISGEIIIFYDLIDEESDTCSIDFYYSLDNGLDFIKCDNITGDVINVRPGVRRSLKWKTRPELNGDYNEVKLKITAHQGANKYGKPCLSPSFPVKNNRVPGVFNVTCAGGSNEIEVKFDLIDADAHECTVEVYYSLNNGADFIKTSNIKFSDILMKPGRSKKLIWYSNRDFHTSEEKVKLKITPFDKNSRGYEAVSEAFAVANNEAPVISGLKIEGDSEEILIYYDLYDLENNTCEVKLWYLTDGAAEYVKSVNITGDCAAVISGAGHVIKWNSRMDFSRDYSGVKVKLMADDGNLKSAGCVSEPFKISNNRPPVIKNISIDRFYGDISISYNIFDEDGDDCDIEVFYSIDNGVNYFKTLNITGDIKRVASGGEYRTITWRSAEDCTAKFAGALIKLVAADKPGSKKEFIYGPFELNNEGLCSISNLKVVMNEDGDYCTIVYDLESPSEKLCTVEVYYSFDDEFINGGERASNIKGEAVNVKPGAGHKIIWEPAFDFMLDTTVYIKLSPLDKKARGSSFISAPIKINTAMIEVKLTPELWPRESHTHLCDGEKMYIIGGWAGSPNYYNDVTMVEYDVKNGSFEVEISPNHYSSVRHSHSSAVYDNKLWIIGGFFNKSKNDAWYSSDGTTWVEITKNETESVKFSPRDSHASVVFDDGFGDKIFVIGGFSRGYKNDVWCSVTGAQWTCITAETNFSPRVGHSATVFKNNIYIIGGYDGGVYKNDIWRSPDGIRWEKITDNADFMPRRAHAAVVYKDKLWIIGGYGENETYYNDIWQSSDGASWRKVKNDVPYDNSFIFAPRRGHSAVVYKNKLWIFGGYGGVNYFNDLWRFK